MRIDKKAPPKKNQPATQKLQRLWFCFLSISHSEMKPQHSNPPAVVLHFYTLLKTQSPLQKLLCAHEGLSLRHLWICALSRGETNTGVCSWAYRAEIQQLGCTLVFQGWAGQHSTSIRSVCTPCVTGDGKETTNSQFR